MRECEILLNYAILAHIPRRPRSRIALSNDSVFNNTYYNIAKFKKSDSVKYGEGMKSFMTLLGGGEWTRTLNCTVMFFTNYRYLRFLQRPTG